jgi:tetratricopeptide (TPR) repeat protein
MYMKSLTLLASATALLYSATVWAEDKTPITVYAPQDVKLSDWIEVKTDHFIIYGNVSDQEMRKFATRVERFDSAMRALLNSKQTTKVTIYLVDLSKVQDLAGDGDVLGFYQGSAQGPQIITTTGSIRYNNNIKVTAQYVMYHEYTHHMLLSNQDVIYPGWLTEGMAEFFATVIVNDDGSLTFGSTPAHRESSITAPNRLSVKQLLDTDGRKLDDADNSQRYSRGWLLYHYLTLGKKRPINQLYKFLELINEKGLRPVEAGQQAFGDLNKLDNELEVYVRQAKLPGFTLPADKVGGQTIEMELRQMRASEAEIMPTRLRSAVGVTKVTAPKVVAKAQPIAAKYPNDPFVQRAYAEMAFDADNLIESIVAADRSLAIDPNNLMAMVYKGRVAAKQAEKSKSADGWKEARRWFLKANKVDPEHPLPFVLFYDTFGAEGKPVPDSALNGLLRATVLAPQDPSVNMRVGYGLIQAGDLKAARNALGPVAFNPHAKSDNASAKVVRLIDNGATKDAVLEEAKKGKLDKVNEFIPPEDEKKDEKKGKDKKG